MTSFIDLPQQEEFNETINEIIELRSSRKYLFETNISRNELRKEALGILKERISFLRQSSRDLHSVVSAVNNRSFFTEEPDFISGEVRPNAPVGDYEIEILQLGDKQLLVSEPLSGDIELPMSKIEIKLAEEKIKFDFRGGDPRSFVRIFNQATKSYFTANWVRKSEDENFFVVQANQVGDRYRLNLQKDSGEVFRALKIFKPKPPIIKTFINSKSLSDMGWSSFEGDMAGVIIPPGAIPNSWSEMRSVDLPSNNSGLNELRDGAVPVNLTVNFLETRNVFFKMNVLTPYGLIFREGGSNQSDNLSSTNLSQADQDFSKNNQAFDRTREEVVRELKEQNQPIIVLDYTAEGEMRSKTFTWNNVYDDRIWISDTHLGARLDKTVEFHSVKFINDTRYPYVVGKWFRSLYDTNQERYLPINEKISPTKVKFKFYSIEMERESAIVDDLIDGVSLNLLKVKDGPVSFSIQNSIEGYDQKIKNFVGQYNYTLDFINLTLASSRNELSKSELEPDMERMISVFNSDINIQRLKDKMLDILRGKYIVKENQRSVFLQEIGFKVFNSLRNPYHINGGKLELDEGLLKTKLLDYGDDIKNLFRYDRNGDYAPDDGFAYRMDRLLGEYIAPNSVFTSMDNNLDKEKRSLEISLESEQRRIDSYREKLEFDFSKVKQARQQQEQLEKWLDNNQ